MRCTFRRECIYPGHRVARLDHTEIKIQFNWVEGIARVEIIAVESENGSEMQRIWLLENSLVNQIQKVTAGGDLCFEFAQAVLKRCPGKCCHLDA